MLMGKSVVSSDDAHAADPYIAKLDATAASRGPSFRPCLSPTGVSGMHGHARGSSSQQTTHHCEQYSTRSSLDINPAMTPPMNSLPCRRAAHQFLSTNTTDCTASLQQAAVHKYAI
jgi:hypothetical protein